MTRKSAPESNRPPESADKVKESAQQIWLAGLGAFAKAQAEGGKVFEALVKDGLAMQRTTQAAAEAKIAEATQKFSSMASGLSSPAAQPWDRLETIFEDRVAKALARLGTPSRADWEQLTARLEALEALVPKPSAKPAKTKRPAPKPAAKTAPQPAVKRSISKRN